MFLALFQTYSFNFGRDIQDYVPILNCVHDPKDISNRPRVNSKFGYTNVSWGIFVCLAVTCYIADCPQRQRRVDVINSKNFMQVWLSGWTTQEGNLEPDTSPFFLPPCMVPNLAMGSLYCPSWKQTLKSFKESQ